MLDGSPSLSVICNCMPQTIREEFENGNWTISKSSRRFSSISIDQAHEQANKQVKGVGGILGLTENPAMLERWILTSPVISRVLDAFTETIDVEVEDTVLPHHEEGQAS